MTEGIYTRMVRNNLTELSMVFKLTNDEFLKCIGYAEKVGWQSCKPSNIAIALIRIVKKDLKNKDIYKLAQTEFQTVRKYTCICCHLLNKKQIWF